MASAILRQSLAFFLASVVFGIGGLRAEEPKVSKECSFHGIPMQGKVQVVNSFPDFKVQKVASFPDLKIQWVGSFADSCGKWQKVESFPDFKIQYVESFPDLKIQAVSAFPGLP